MNAIERAAAADLLNEANRRVFEEDAVDFTLDIWEANTNIADDDEEGADSDER